MDLFLVSALGSAWTPCQATIAAGELVVTPVRGGDGGKPVRISLTGASLRKLQPDVSSYRPRVPNDMRVEIEIVPRDARVVRTDVRLLGSSQRKSHLLRFPHDEGRSEWLGALGHQIVRLGEGGVGCYDECPLLHPAPLMFGEIFIQVEIDVSAEMRADEARDEDKQRKDAAQEAAAKRFSFRR